MGRSHWASDTEARLRAFVQEHRHTTLGCWFIGGMLDALLLGLVIAQTVHYFHHCRGDGRVLRSYVGVLFVLNVLKSAQTLATLWTKLIVGYVDVSVFQDPPWYTTTHTLSSQIVAVVCQSFFVVRLYRFFGRDYPIPMTVIVLSILLALGGCCSLSFYVLTDKAMHALKAFSTSMVVAMSGMVGSDLLITLMTTWWLWRAKVEDFQSDGVDSLVSKIIYITWATAIPPAIAAILTMSTYLTLAKHDIQVFMTFTLAMSKLYTLSVLYTLNSRQRLRETRDPYRLTTKVLTGLGPVFTSDSVEFCERGVDAFPGGNLRNLRAPGASDLSLPESKYSRTDSLFFTPFKQQPPESQSHSEDGPKIL